jgi:hypothetical protein
MPRVTPERTGGSPMQLRTLGRADLKITLLVFGRLDGRRNG